MYDMVSGWCFNGYTWLCNVDVALATSGCVNSVLRQMICCSSSSNNVSIFLIRGDKGCHMPYKGCHMLYKGCHIPYKGCHYHPPSCLCLYFRVRARQSFRSWPSLPCSQTAPLWCLGGIPPPPPLLWVGHGSVYVYVYANGGCGCTVPNHLTLLPTTEHHNCLLPWQHFTPPHTHTHTHTHLPFY